MCACVSFRVRVFQTPAELSETKYIDKIIKEFLKSFDAKTKRRYAQKSLRPIGQCRERALRLSKRAIAFRDYQLSTGSTISAQAGWDFQSVAGKPKSLINKHITNRY